MILILRPRNYETVQNTGYGVITETTEPMFRYDVSACSTRVEKYLIVQMVYHRPM